MTKTKVAEAARSLAASGEISQTAATILSKPDRDVHAAQVDLGFEEPAFACFLIDASPSMKDLANSVIEGQHRAIETLRDSSKARKRALYVGQWTFSTSIQMINSFKKLSRSGGDEVVLLDDTCYRPQDGQETALYQSTFHVLQEIAANIAYAKKTGVKAKCTIALITDGMDNVGGVDPSDIRTIVGELKAKQQFLARSLVIGIQHPDLPMTRIQKIKEDLGFDDAVSVDKSDREIRKAFVLASQSAVTAFA